MEAEVAAEARASASSRKAVDQRIEQVLGPAYDWNSTSKVRLGFCTRSNERFGFKGRLSQVWY